jgi:sugar-specific transcriptional regulator TrmB
MASKIRKRPARGQHPGDALRGNEPKAPRNARVPEPLPPKDPWTPPALAGYRHHFVPGAGADPFGSPESSSDPWEEAPAPIPASSTSYDRPYLDSALGGLVHLGLSVHEARMLRSLLESGASTARDAIQHSRLDRATGYRVLSRLRARGLVRSTGYRPQRFVGVDATRLMDRVTSFWQDQIELHRELRKLYESSPEEVSRAVPVPGTGGGISWTEGTPKAIAHAQILPGHARIGAQMRELIDRSRDEIGALLRPSLIPEPHRTEVRASLGAALERNVRVRLVVDCQPPEFDFISDLLREFPDVGPGLELRSFAPQLSHLVVVDGRSSLRCLHSPYLTDGIPDVGLASDDVQFVRSQSGRFQATWRESIPLEEALRSPEGAIMAPPSASPELIRWVQRVDGPGPHGAVGVSFGLSMPRGWNRPWAAGRVVPPNLSWDRGVSLRSSSRIFPTFGRAVEGTERSSRRDRLIPIHRQLTRYPGDRYMRAARAEREANSARRSPPEVPSSLPPPSSSPGSAASRDSPDDPYRVPAEPPHTLAEVSHFVILP